MKKIVLLFLLLSAFFTQKAQSVDSLIVNYYDNYPYAYKENGTLKGIEIDIIEEYVNWLKQKKNFSVTVTYKPITEFGNFYNTVKDGSSKMIGLGSVTINSEREKEVSYSPPYLQNVAVLITPGKIPTIREKNSAEVSRVLGGLSAIAVGRSSHMSYINTIKKMYLPMLKINTAENQSRVLEMMLSDGNSFGYVDIIAYWSFLKSNPGKFLKIQKAFNESKEMLGFIMPKKSTHSALLTEFFESGFGFTSTKVYHQILEKYLGYEILESVELK